MKAVSAELFHAVDLSDLPVGICRGVGGGYEVRVVINGTRYRLKTDDGIRTPRAECTVEVRPDGVTVDYDLSTAFGFSSERQRSAGCGEKGLIMKTDVDRNSAAPPCYAPVAITCWKTEDGRVFEHEASAEHHQENLNAAKRANEVFKNGGTVADGLRAGGFAGDIDPVLERVTAETQLVISHWQCRDTPGYKPCRFECGLSMYVGGHAGSWSGPYGNSVPIRDLIQYAKDKRTVFGA